MRLIKRERNMKNIPEIEPLIFCNKINKYLGTNIKPIYIIICILSIIFEIFYITSIYLEKLYENIYTDNSNIINKFLIEQYENLILSFYIPVLIFYILNKLFSFNFWDFLGITVNDNLISSSEPKQYNKLIYYPINTYSSSFQICAGTYFIMRSSFVINYKTTFILGVSVYCLGVFSYLWWSSSKEIIRKIDHLFMELHCISLGFSFISLIGFNSNYNIENVLNFIIFFYAYIRFKFINKAKIGLCIIFVNICAFILMFNLKNIGYINLYYGGYLSILIGIFTKSLDKLYKFIWGTAFFHLFASLSFILCFEWSQTLSIK